MKKGFTLIELLAVIVILAIIALIATPIILGIINDARDEAKKRSAELVYTGVEYAYTTSLYATTNGAAVGTPTLATIKANLNVENATSEISGDKLVITTSDGVTCDVTVSGQGFNVKCGNNGDILNKDLATK